MISSFVIALIRGILQIILASDSKYLLYSVLLLTIRINKLSHPSKISIFSRTYNLKSGWSRHPTTHLSDSFTISYSPTSVFHKVSFPHQDFPYKACGSSRLTLQKKKRSISSFISRFDILETLISSHYFQPMNL